MSASLSHLRDEGELRNNVQVLFSSFFFMDCPGCSQSACDACGGCGCEENGCSCSGESVGEGGEMLDV